MPTYNRFISIKMPATVSVAKNLFVLLLAETEDTSVFFVYTKQFVF